MTSVLDLSSEKAFRYFMEPENYCTLELPKYISFQPVLDFVEQIVGSLTLDDILKVPRKMPSEYEDVNYKFLVKKDARFTFRPMQMANPYLYYLLVREMTKKPNWKALKKRFKDFRCDEIEVSSIPLVKGGKDKSHKSANVSFWVEKMEQRSLELSLNYRYLFVTDISNCYPSIYTHTIAWALMGKDEAKRKRNQPGLLGNVIDRYIQGMQYRQTNGLPQGSVLFDFIAEMVLGYADMILTERLVADSLTNYKILRYRDDYRIFSNSKEDLEQIAFRLQEVLSELNFQLNSKKTMMTEEVVQASIKTDKIAYAARVPLYKRSGSRITTTASSLQQEALYIHQFSKEYPNSGTIMKLLTIFSQRLTKRKKNLSEQVVDVLISIFSEVALVSPKAYRLIIQLFSVLINQLPTTEKRENKAQAIYDKFKMIPNIGEIQIWLQHITYQMPNGIQYTEPLCRIVEGESNVELWNNEWVRDDLKVNFPQYDICTSWLRDSFTPVIDIDEVSLFDLY